MSVQKVYIMMSIVIKALVWDHGDVVMARTVISVDIRGKENNPVQYRCVEALEIQELVSRNAEATG